MALSDYDNVQKYYFLFNKIKNYKSKIEYCKKQIEIEITTLKNLKDYNTLLSNDEKNIIDTIDNEIK